MQIELSGLLHDGEKLGEKDLQLEELGGHKDVRT